VTDGAVRDALASAAEERLELFSLERSRASFRVIAERIVAEAS
jgi:hypothetical protein